MLQRTRHFTLKSPAGHVTTVSMSVACDDELDGLFFEDLSTRFASATMQAAHQANCTIEHVTTASAAPGAINSN